MPPIFYDWFTFSRDLHRYETCWSVTDHLNIATFRTQKYGCFSIRASTIYSWNSMQNLLLKDLSLKNLTSKKIKYFLTKHVIKILISILLAIAYRENYKLMCIFSLTFN